MSSLLDDYVERLVLRALAGIALFAAMAGLLAIPFGVLLTALRNVAPSEGAPAELLGLPPWVLAIGGGALAASAYLEGRRRPVLDATVPATPAKNIPAIVAMVLLPGPAIAVMPPLSDWLTATAWGPTAARYRLFWRRSGLR